MKIKNCKIKNFKKGFTLVELLIVIIIIGILASMIIVTLTDSRKKSRDSKRQTDINSIASALETYYADTHEYPALLTDLETIVPPSTNGYISAIPEDPLPTPWEAYQYTYNSTDVIYFLAACLEKDSGNLRAGVPLPTGISVCNPAKYYLLQNGQPYSP